MAGDGLWGDEPSRHRCSRSEGLRPEGAGVFGAHLTGGEGARGGRILREGDRTLTRVTRKTLSVIK